MLGVGDPELWGYDSLVATTHEQKGLVVADSVSELLELGVELEDRLDLTREGMQAIDDLAATLGKGDAVLGELKSHHEQSNVLRSVGLEHY